MESSPSSEPCLAGERTFNNNEKTAINSTTEIVCEVHNVQNCKENMDGIDTIAKSKFTQTKVKDGLTDAVSLDCEMVGLGRKGCRSSLGRVSIVNEYGHVLLDEYVRQTERVTDYRTRYSGIRPSDLHNADDFQSVLQKVKTLITGRKLVGHALMNDFKVLHMSHPQYLVRDTMEYKGFHKQFQTKTPSLRALSLQLTGVKIQKREHSSVEDARAAMRLYVLCRDDWNKRMEGIPKENMVGLNGTVIEKKGKNKKRKTDNQTRAEIEADIDILVKKINGEDAPDSKNHNQEKKINEANRRKKNYTPFSNELTTIDKHNEGNQGIEDMKKKRKKRKRRSSSNAELTSTSGNGDHKSQKKIKTKADVTAVTSNISTNEQNQISKENENHTTQDTRCNCTAQRKKRKKRKKKLATHDGLTSNSEVSPN